MTGAEQVLPGDLKVGDEVAFARMVDDRDAPLVLRQKIVDQQALMLSVYGLVKGVTRGRSGKVLGVDVPSHMWITLNVWNTHVIHSGGFSSELSFVDDSGAEIPDSGEVVQIFSFYPDETLVRLVKE